jgi:dolichyl-diphosphooligosaccharide--protein glycosyltransferase
MATQLKNATSKIFNRIPSLNRILRQVPKEDLLLTLCLALIVGIAVTVRVLPYNWGYQLSEFDPYFHYDVAEYVVQNGFSSWSDWHTDRSWYPTGRDIGSTSFPGLPFSSALLYLFLTGIGIQTTVYNVCVAFPVLMAALTCIVLYYFGKDLGGPKVGLLAALFLALSPAYIGRTSLGFFDTENVGIFGILLVSLCYLRSLDEERGRITSLAYSILAGLFLGYVFASWGASRYVMSLIALFTFVLVIAKRYSQRLLISYGVLILTSLPIAVLLVPTLRGIRFVTEFESLAVIGVFLILLMKELNSRLKTSNLRLVFTILFLLAIGSSAVVLQHFNVISLPVRKFMSVLNPFQRVVNPLVESVQEHRPATWSAFYYQFGLLVFLAPLGIFFTFQKLTAKSLFVITFMLTALYFSASMIRLTIILAPALCVVGSLALVEVLRPFVNIVTQRTFTRRRRLSLRVGRGFSTILIIGLFFLTFLPLLRGVDSAYSPTTIASSSIPLRANIGDWSEALAWMKQNLPRDTVVASWWDYGYWITVKGEKITLADNGTINSTQIAQIGRMFMSNETQALTILKDYDVDYVTVFTTIALAQQGQILFGDEVKWRWMAKIGGLDDTALEDTSITSQIAEAWSMNTQNQNLLNWYQRFGQLPIPHTDTVLTKLMIHGAFGILPPEHFQLSFSSSDGLVFVYKVLYA